LCVLLFCDMSDFYWPWCNRAEQCPGQSRQDALGWDHRVDRVLSFFSNRPNWDYPTPSHAGKCAPPSLVSGGLTRLQEREWGSPKSDEGTYTVVLYIRINVPTLWPMYSFWGLPYSILICIIWDIFLLVKGIGPRHFPIPVIIIGELQPCLVPCLVNVKLFRKFRDLFLCKTGD
jgi:hypothetical protein